MSGIIDLSVEHGWADPADLTEYMPAAWREYVGTPGSLPGGAGGRPLLMSSAFTRPRAHDPAADAYRGSLDAAISDPGRLARDWLLPEGIETALLTHGAMRRAPACVNPRLASVLVKAANDWTIERWLDDDESGRLRAALLVDEQVPESAAAEVSRLGSHEKVSAVMLGGSGAARPAGHPIWEPLYDVLCDLDLPLLIYAGGDGVQDNITYPTAAGPPSSYAELRALAAQSLITHLVSLIGQGTFERHPRLRVVLAGGGFSWLPSIVWRIDTNYNALRIEAPWVKRPPSEYVSEHVRVAVGPYDGPPDPGGAEHLAAAYPEFAGLLCFASGYPAETAPATLEGVRGVLPETWWSRITSRNAAGFMRF